MTAPRGQYAPTEHLAVHAGSVRPVELPKRPAWHGSGTAAPSTQKDPAGQSCVQATGRATSELYLP